MRTSTRLMLIAIQSWKAWRAKRRLARTFPAVVERRDEQLPVLRKNHKSTRHIYAQNYRAMHEALGLRRSK